MIRNSFIMLDGVGEKTEQLLWKKGILSWDDFIASDKVPRIIRTRKRLYEETLIYFSHELRQNNEKPFAEFIRRKDHWRLFEYFKSNLLCIDIETNGLPADAGGEITVVGLYDGRDFKQYVQGINLFEEAIAEELGSCKVLVSFFGSVFDIPFLKRKFGSLDFTMPHFDLCFASRKVGMAGGLKKIESLLGFSRADEIRNLSGFDAIRLWKEWEIGDRKALDLLLHYNRSDTVNLLGIAEMVYNRLCEQTGFREYYEQFLHR
jgi:uncharacterized protein YprB with RNaseH-like and TPR domain